MSNDLLLDFSVNKESKTVYMTREFNADLELVWEAWTTAEILDQWWGPKPMVAKTKFMNPTRIAFYLLVASSALLAQKPAAPSLAFEVATVKPSAPPDSPHSVAALRTLETGSTPRVSISERPRS